MIILEISTNVSLYVLNCSKYKNHESGSQQFAREGKKIKHILYLLNCDMKCYLLSDGYQTCMCLLEYHTFVTILYPGSGYHCDLHF